MIHKSYQSEFHDLTQSEQDDLTHSDYHDLNQPQYHDLNLQKNLNCLVKLPHRESFHGFLSRVGHWDGKIGNVYILEKLGLSMAMAKFLKIFLKLHPYPQILPHLQMATLFRLSKVLRLF